MRDVRQRRRLPLRVLLYVTGLFCMALGVALAVNSNLGVSPVNALPYVLSQTNGWSMSVWVILVYSIYILLQLVLLRRPPRLTDLLQLLFSLVFGSFVDVTKWLVGSFCLPTYAGRLLMLAVSILLIAVGVALYIETKLVPMPMDGLTLAIAERAGIPFHRAKVLTDCLSVTASVLCSLLFLHRLEGIREGTILTAVITGKVMARVKGPLEQIVQRVCFPRGETPSV